MKALFSIAAKAGSAAVWLWKLDLIQSPLLTWAVRIGVPSLAAIIGVKIVDAYAANPVSF